MTPGSWGDEIEDGKFPKLFDQIGYYLRNREGPLKLFLFFTVKFTHYLEITT